jgi:serine/threonine protein kinase
MPVMESKAADVFAFGMFAVEVFTGKIPFEEQKNEAVVLRISRGGRPEMPENAQVVGLTSEMWKLLESCWQQNPKKRPTMEEVVKRWQKFVENNGGSNGVIECVQITLVIRISSSVPFSTSMIDLGARNRQQDSHRDSGRGLRPIPNLHRGFHPETNDV